MTTFKRIMAVVLAVMLIASIGIIGASAAGEKLIIKGKTNFTFDVYKVASLKSTVNGEYDFTGLDTETSVQNFIKATDDANHKVDNKTLLETLDAATTPGNKLTTLTSETGYEITEPGIYYVKYTGYTGSGDAEVTKNSAIVWPVYSDGSWSYGTGTPATYTVDLASKTNSEYVTKYFVGDTALAIGSKTVAQGDVVDFVLEANIVGNKENKVDRFEIWDKMCAGLQYNNDIKVYYDSISAANETNDFNTPAPTKITTDTDYITNAGLNAADTAHYNGGVQFAITAKDTVLDADAFYNHTKVYVTYSATVLNTAKTGAIGNPNKDGLVYKYGTEANPTPVQGREVTVFTASVSAKKVNGAKADAPLAGAIFGLYNRDNNTLLAQGTSDTSGNIVFKKVNTDTESIKLGKGNYRVAEISAPDGFAKTTATYDFEVTDASAKTGTAIFEAKDAGKAGIQNFPTKMPETGGAGTLMFTLIGAGLVLLAGAMFVIIMKKRASSK